MLEIMIFPTPLCVVGMKRRSHLVSIILCTKMPYFWYWIVRILPINFSLNCKLNVTQQLKSIKPIPLEFPNTEYAKMPQRKYGEISDALTKYILGTIAANKDARWTFLFMHKPVWKNENETNFKKN